MICPNYKNKQVFKEFNEIIESLGGKPMTEEEFRSALLRNLRVDRDYSAMNAAYRIWHRNNGNAIDMAPNGNPSVLFQSLLDHFNGDRAAAIRAKTNVYSDEFFNWFGDWTHADKPLVKFYGPTMGKTTAAKTNKNLVDFDDIVREDIKKLAEKQNKSVRQLKTESPQEYVDLLKRVVEKWRNDPTNKGKTLVVSNAALAKEDIFDNKVQIPSKDVFVKRLIERSEENKSKKELTKEAELYYDDLMSKWYINPTINDTFVSDIEKEVSKVVDENGEPLVVYHASNLNFNTYRNSYSEHGFDAGIFFSNSKIYAKIVAGAKLKDSVYLNIKNPTRQENITRETTSRLFLLEEPISFGDWMESGGIEEDYSKYKTNAEKNQHDGIIGEDADKGNLKERSIEFVAKSPNQIKHVENLGTWSTEDNNIYKVKAYIISKEDLNNAEKLAESLGLGLQFRSVQPEIFFGINQYAKLKAGESVSTKDIVINLINSKLIPIVNQILAAVLSKHDIPVLFGENEFGTPMEIVRKGEGFVIIIDESQISDLKASNASNMLLHEIVHALSVNALESPKTSEEARFAETTRAAYEIFDKLIPENEIDRNDSILGAYILNNQYEFAAEFATNRNARLLLFEAAVQYDKQTNGKAILRLKRFINSVSDLLFNKRLFKLKQDEFIKYKNLIDNFLVHRSVINKGNITDTDMFKAIYSLLDLASEDRQIDADRRANMVRYLSGIKSYEIKAYKKPIRLRTRIATALNTRTLGITASKALSEEEKIRQVNSIRSLIDLLTNDNIKSVVAISLLLQQTIPQMIEDLEEIRLHKESTDEYYMYHMHDNFGTYATIFQEINNSLDDLDFKEALEKELEGSGVLDRLGAITNLSELKNIVSKAQNVANSGVGHMRYILYNNLPTRMAEIAKETGSEELNRWINEMESVGYDTNSLLAALGSKDGSTDTTVRAIIYLINKANRAREKAVYGKSVELLELKDKLKPGEDMKDIFEYDDEGLATGNMVRSLNYGKQKKAYRKALEKINELYGLNKNNRRIPDDNTEVVYKSLFKKNSKHEYIIDENGKRVPNKMTLRKAWNLLKNEWLEQNVERKYKAEYYEAYASLSEETLEAINNIRDRINTIKSKAKRDEQGNYLFDSLTKEDWDMLNGLYIERRSLSSFYNINGNRKLEGTPEYNIAKELLELNKALYDPNREYHDKMAWAKARQEVLNKAIEDSTDEEGNVNETKVSFIMKKWDKRNSRRKYKTDLEGHALIYKQIDDELYEVTKLKEEPIYEFNGDNGETYKANKKRINEMLAIFKDSTTREVNLDFLPASVKKKILDLLKENYKIKKAAIKADPVLAKESKKYDKARGKLYDKYFVTRSTDYWLARHSDDASIMPYDESSRLPKWATKLIVRSTLDEETGESYLDRYTELVPGDGWINSTERDDLLNPEFEKLSKEEGNEGMSMIPKKSLYDNSKTFNKIKNSPSMYALYKAILNTMGESNQEFYNGNKIDSYKLPSITGSMFTYMKSIGAEGVKKYIGELLGYIGNGESIRQDEAFGMAISTILGDVDHLSEFIRKENQISVNKTTGIRADNRQFNIIPPRYTTPLEDPSLISPDLIGIVCEYYKSAMNVKHKDKIKDTIESFIDMLEYRDYTKQTIDKETGEIKEHVTEGKNTNTYKSARKAVDMFLYDIKSDENKAGNWNLSRLAHLSKQATTAINLGGSPVVALTGFFTSSYAHTINSMVGNRAYGFTEACQAAGIFLWSWLKSGFGIGTVAKRNTRNKVKGVMELFNLVDLQEKKYKKSHLNRAFKFFSDNYIFGMLTQLDYVIKSNIAISLCLSHRLLDGRFVAKEDILNNSRGLSTEQLAEILKKWKEGKTVWDILEFNNEGKLLPNESYKEAYDIIDNMLKARILKCAENADGVATETQKAAVSTSVLGAAALIHRQYLPLMLQDRYAETVYDMDTQLYGQGMFRTIFNSMSLFLLKAINDAYIANKAGDYHWYSAAFKKDFYNEIMFNKRFYSSIKSGGIIDKYKQYFYSNESDEEFKLSRARRKHIKKFAIELAMFMFVFKMLMPLLYSAADDKKNKKNLALQLAAYTARRVEWESFNPYRFDDMASTIKTPFAEQSLIDKTQAILYHVTPRSDLFNTLLNLDNNSKTSDDIVKKGVYKGWKKWERDWFKIVPYHNAWEQVYGSRDKRRYYENQIMRVDKNEK